MSHPYTDPWHSGLVQLTPSQRLMNADTFRQRRYPSMLAGGDSADSPLAGLSDSIGTVLGAAGYGRPQSAPKEREPVESDADEPSQGVVSDGGSLYHVRGNGDGTSTVSHIGDNGQQDGE